MASQLQVKLTHSHQQVRPMANLPELRPMASLPELRLMVSQQAKHMLNQAMASLPLQATVSQQWDSQQPLVMASLPWASSQTPMDSQLMVSLPKWRNSLGSQLPSSRKPLLATACQPIRHKCGACSLSSPMVDLLSE